MEKILKNESGILYKRLYRIYFRELIHRWLKTLLIIGFTSIPLFLILDWFIVPKVYFPEFALYRGIVAAFLLGQLVVVHYTLPSKYSFLHGYVAAALIGAMISAMTEKLGGFNSGYYVGLNLLILATNVMIPWRVADSFLNGLIIVMLYVGVNLYFPHEYEVSNFINNVFFLATSVIITMSISFVKGKLTRQEFESRIEAEVTRDALWGEMEIAKKIQTALLPRKSRIGNYEIASLMIPAEKVGGDYFDILESPQGKHWLGIGDVSGHGVESGLIMMMAQTSIATAIASDKDCEPSSILESVNGVIMENISRLKADRYMTLSLLHLQDTCLVTAGRHQDIFIYRAKTRHMDQIPVKGTWIGVLENIRLSNPDLRIPVGENDVIFLFTDGLTEAFNERKEMFGIPRLARLFQKYARLPVEEIAVNVYNTIKTYQREQSDDITIAVLRNTGRIPQ